MTINAWKTSFIGLNKPAKVLSGTADSVTALSLWPYANSADDPYWSGGPNPKSYRWEVSFTVSEKTHGSNLTRTPFKFDAQDIEVGDFVAGASDGKVLQITSVLSKTNSEVVAIVEDRLRYNTFRDPAGIGLFGTPGPVIFFQINELGFPMLDPLPGEAATDFFTNVMSRFQYMNPLTNYLLEKTNHGFEQGDAVCIEAGTFSLSNSNNISKFLGTVVHPGPGPDQFILRPANGIVDFVPGLPGAVGDYLYPSLDGSGDLTTNDNSRRPIYMKVADAITTSTTGTGTDPVGTDGDIVEINRTQVTLYSGNGTYGVDEAVALINVDTPTHKITAVKVGAATETFSDIAGQGSAYGIIAGYTPFSASINGITVNFTTTTSGSAAYGDPVVADQNDMVADINAAKIPDIVASLVNGSDIKLRHNAGGAITIVNVTADANSNNFAGATSVSSLPLITAANTTTRALRLIRADGGPLTIRDFAGQFLDTAGVLSGQNGRYALGLNIEQGIRSSGTAVVANIVARDALSSLVGDQCYVIDDGNGEWATFTYSGTQWTKVGGERSVATDARTLVNSINLATKPTGTIELGTISTGRKILNISVDVESATSGVTGVITMAAPPLWNPAWSNRAADPKTGVWRPTNYVAFDYAIDYVSDSFSITPVANNTSSGTWMSSDRAYSYYEIVDYNGQQYRWKGQGSGNSGGSPDVDAIRWEAGPFTDNSVGGSGYAIGDTFAFPTDISGFTATITVLDVEDQPGNVSTISVGTAANNSLFMSTFDNRLLGSATYMLDPNYITSDYTDLIANLTNFAGNTGTVTIKLTYV